MGQKNESLGIFSFSFDFYFYLGFVLGSDMKIPVYRIKVPEYHVKSKPDPASIGAKIDRIIKKHFLGQKVAIRCIGSQEHKGKSVNDLVEIIKKLGTDRYDPSRKGEKYENIWNKRIDFFALDFRIKEKGKYMENFIEPFYTYPKQDKKRPVRIDIWRYKKRNGICISCTP